MFGLVDPLKEAMIQFVAGILLPSMVLIALSFTPFNFWVKIALVTGTGILGIELVQPYLMAFPGHQKYGEKDRKILVGLLRGFGYAGLLVFLLGAAGHILSGVDYQPASHILGILIPSMLSGYLAIFLPHSLNNFFNPVRASGTGGIGRGHLVKRAKELAAILAMPEGPAVEESLAQFSNRSPQEGPIIEVDSWAEVLEALHEGGLDDQSIPPISLVDEKGHPVGLIEDGDTVLNWNIRTDRAKPLTAAFLGIPSEDQTGGLLGNVPHPQIHMVTMTEYDGKFEDHAAIGFQPPPVLDTYAEVVGRAGVRQWVVGESEKHKAIAWFKNGRKNLGFTQSSQNHFDAISAPVRTYLREDLGIEMHVVESRKVGTHDQAPQMRAAEITEILLRGIGEDVEDMFVNYANADMVGHATTKPKIFDKAVDAILTLDKELERLIPAALDSGYTILITADHGNAEELVVTQDGKIKANPGHTSNPVPLIILGLKPGESVVIRPDKKDSVVTLADVAPTLLSLRGLESPKSWNRKSLLEGSIIPDRNRKILRILLDGYGVREETSGNAMAEAASRKGSPLLMDRLVKDPLLRRKWGVLARPIQASGEYCGYGKGIAGTTEFGHVLIDAGRWIDSDKVLIDRAIEDGTFNTKPALVEAMERAQKGEGKLHLMGLVTTKFVHASTKHIEEILKMAASYGLKGDQVLIHAFTDGRDETFNGIQSLNELQDLIARYGVGKIVTVGGRAWYMDRDNRWHRLTAAYRSLTEGVAALHIRLKHFTQEPKFKESNDSAFPSTALGTGRRNDPEKNEDDEKSIIPQQTENLHGNGGRMNFDELKEILAVLLPVAVSVTFVLTFFVAIGIEIFTPAKPVLGLAKLVFIVVSILYGYLLLYDVLDDPRDFAIKIINPYAKLSMDELIAKDRKTLNALILSRNHTAFTKRDGYITEDNEFQLTKTYVNHEFLALIKAISKIRRRMKKRDPTLDELLPEQKKMSVEDVVSNVAIRFIEGHKPYWFYEFFDRRYELQLVMRESAVKRAVGISENETIGTFLQKVEEAKRLAKQERRRGIFGLSQTDLENDLNFLLFEFRDAFRHIFVDYRLRKIAQKWGWLKHFLTFFIIHAYLAELIADTFPRTRFKRFLTKHLNNTSDSHPNLRASGSGSENPLVYGLWDPLKEGTIQFIVGVFIPAILLSILALTPLDLWIKISLAVLTGALGIEWAQSYLMTLPGHQKYNDNDRKILATLLRGFGYGGLIVFLLSFVLSVTLGAEPQSTRGALEMLMIPMLAGFLTLILPHSSNNLFNPIRASGSDTTEPGDGEESDDRPLPEQPTLQAPKFWGEGLMKEIRGMYPEGLNDILVRIARIEEPIPVFDAPTGRMRHTRIYKHYLAHLLPVAAVQAFQVWRYPALRTNPNPVFRSARKTTDIFYDLMPFVLSDQSREGNLSDQNEENSRYGLSRLSFYAGPSTFFLNIFGRNSLVSSYSINAMYGIRQPAIVRVPDETTLLSVFGVLGSNVRVDLPADQFVRRNMELVSHHRNNKITKVKVTGIVVQESHRNLINDTLQALEIKSSNIPDNLIPYFRRGRDGTVSLNPDIRLDRLNEELSLRPKGSIVLINWDGGWINLVSEDDVLSVHEIAAGRADISFGAGTMASATAKVRMAYREIDFQGREISGVAASEGIQAASPEARIIKKERIAGGLYNLTLVTSPSLIHVGGHHYLRQLSRIEILKDGQEVKIPVLVIEPSGNVLIVPIVFETPLKAYFSQLADYTAKGYEGEERGEVLLKIAEFLGDIGGRYNYLKGYYSDALDLATRKSYSDLARRVTASRIYYEGKEILENDPSEQARVRANIKFIHAARLGHPAAQTVVGTEPSPSNRTSRTNLFHHLQQVLNVSWVGRFTATQSLQSYIQTHGEEEWVEIQILLSRLASLPDKVLSNGMAGAIVQRILAASLQNTTLGERARKFLENVAARKNASILFRSAFREQIAIQEISRQERMQAFALRVQEKLDPLAIGEPPQGLLELLDAFSAGEETRDPEHLTPQQFEDWVDQTAKGLGIDRRTLLQNMGILDAEPASLQDHRPEPAKILNHPSRSYEMVGFGAAMEALLFHFFPGNTTLNGKTVVFESVNQETADLIVYFLRNGAKVIVTDRNQEYLDHFAALYPEFDEDVSEKNLLIVDPNRSHASYDLLNLPEVSESGIQEVDFFFPAASHLSDESLNKLALAGVKAILFPKSDESTPSKALTRKIEAMGIVGLPGSLTFSGNQFADNAKQLSNSDEEIGAYVFTQIASSVFHILGVSYHMPDRSVFDLAIESLRRANERRQRTSPSAGENDAEDATPNEYNPTDDDPSTFSLTPLKGFFRKVGAFNHELSHVLVGIPIGILYMLQVGNFKFGDKIYTLVHSKPVGSIGKIGSRRKAVIRLAGVIQIVPIFLTFLTGLSAVRSFHSILSSSDPLSYSLHILQFIIVLTVWIFLVLIPLVTDLYYNLKKGPLREASDWSIFN
ncbi:MAG: hypothetical protein HYY63_01265, partial [Elusimicrobia bacterium]|nr:hypothetical protein [Elusimicrobiota bacterium]